MTMTNFSQEWNSTSRINVLLQNYKSDKIDLDQKRELEVLIFQYSSYLTISSSREGGISSTKSPRHLERRSWGSNMAERLSFAHQSSDEILANVCHKSPQMWRHTSWLCWRPQSPLQNHSRKTTAASRTKSAFSHTQLAISFVEERLL